MPAEPLALFDLDQVPSWVVEVDEVLLKSIDSPGAEWWATQECRTGISARIVYLAIVPVGALLYVSCDNQEQAEWMRGFMVDKGCHPKAISVRQIGHLITCAGCGERRPFWATARRIGRRCRPCWVERTSLSLITSGRPSGGEDQC